MESGLKVARRIEACRRCYVMSWTIGVYVLLVYGMRLCPFVTPRDWVQAEYISLVESFCAKDG